MTKKLKLTKENADQYDVGGVTELPVIKTKDPQTKKTDELTEAIKQLNERIDTQYKVIDKAVRDIKRIKDQISVIAGKLPRG